MIRKIKRKYQAYQERKLIRKQIKEVKKWIDELRDEKDLCKNDENLLETIDGYIKKRYKQLDSLMSKLVDGIE